MNSTHRTIEKMQKNLDAMTEDELEQFKNDFQNLKNHEFKQKYRWYVNCYVLKQYILEKYGIAHKKQIGDTSVYNKLRKGQV